MRKKAAGGRGRRAAATGGKLSSHREAEVAKALPKRRAVLDGGNS